MTIFKFSEKSQQDVRFRTYGGKGNAGVFGRHSKQLADASALPPDSTADDHGRRRYVSVLDDTRVGNIPNADLGVEYDLGKIQTRDEAALMTNISVKAAARKLYYALAESGRVATQGLL